MPAVSAGMLDRAVKRMHQALEIVKDLADLTRGSMSGARRLEQVDLTEVVRRTLARYAEAAAPKNIQATIEAPVQPAMLLADESMLERSWTIW